MRTDRGIFRVDRLDCRLTPFDWAFSREQAARVDAHWAEQCRAKPNLFDGPVLLAHKITRIDQVLRATYFETGFKTFLSWRDFGFPGAPVANCFAMAALRAADGTFLLGEMGAGTANEGKLYFPSGTPDSSDLREDGRVDLEGSVIRELEEETGLTPGDVMLEDGWTIVSEGPAVACMKQVRSLATVAELQARLAAHNAGNAHPELTRLVPVTRRTDYDVRRMPPFMLRFFDGVLGK